MKKQKYTILHLFILFIRCYQGLISPFFSFSCRYYPSCSHYGIEALKKYGVANGSWVTLKRIMRCHPWGGKGYDPVEKIKNTSKI